MHKTRLLAMLVVLAVLAAAGLNLGTPAGQAQEQLADVEGHWAEDEILQLAEEAIVTGYPDGTFKADRPITRAEFATILTRAFELAPTVEERPTFRDLQGHWAREAVQKLAVAGIIEGYPDGTFRPDEQITRAEMTAMVQRAVNSLHGLAEQLPAGWEPTFSDLGSDHWAFAAAELAYQEGILPPYVREEGFQPDEEATRAETAYMVARSLNLEVLEGTLTQADGESQALVLETEEGPRSLILPSDARLIQGDQLVTADELVSQVAVRVIADPYGRARLVEAATPSSTARITDEALQVARKLLTQEQLQALIAGDWTRAGQELRLTLYDLMIERGATPFEAEAILQEDWATLTELGKERLAAAVAAYLALPEELTRALLDGNWARAQELAQSEVAAEILGRYLFPEG
ncbi:MAG: S-layer homology domain-containing protein [Firmicutes bacterium]|nr:S-layer homology domain-containing protein [Bacillota bacterium]